MFIFWSIVHNRWDSRADETMLLQLMQFVYDVCLTMLHVYFPRLAHALIRLHRSASKHLSRFLLRDSRKQKQHNEKKKEKSDIKSKIAPPMAPKDNGARSRRHAVQCRSSALHSQLHDLGNAKQGKYGKREKKKKKMQRWTGGKKGLYRWGGGLCVVKRRESESGRAGWLLPGGLK